MGPIDNINTTPLKEALFASIPANQVNFKKVKKMSSINIEMEAIKQLELDLNPPRARKREIAKRYKMKWENYQALAREYRRRIAFGLDVVTGNKKENDNGE